MEWLLDSATLEDWKRVSGTGLFSAITTNPLLLARAELQVSMQTYKTLYQQALGMDYEHIQLQVFGDDWFHVAQQILDLGEYSIVKIPATEAGFHLVTRLGVPERTTLTGVYSARMGAMAECLGVKYVAPYYARLVESERDVEAIFAGLRASCKRTRVLVASLRSVDQFEHLLGLGHRCFTIPGTLLNDLLSDPMTEAAVGQFEAAAAAQI